MKAMRDIMMIVESPQEIGDVDFNATSPSMNKKILDMLLADKKTVKIDDWHGLTIYRNTSHVFAVDTDRTTSNLVYFIKINVQRWSMIQDTGVTQSALWRDDTCIKTVNITEHVFFDILLPEYRIIITDTQQTDDGKRFWRRRIHDAFTLGLNVYYADHIGPRRLIKITDPRHFDKLQSELEIWGPSIKFQARKLIITDKDLAPKADVDIS